MIPTTVLYDEVTEKATSSNVDKLYHRWVFENHREDSVELLREWVIQEAEFQARALETVQGLSTRVVGKASFKGSSHTFFGK